MTEQQRAADAAESTMIDRWTTWRQLIVDISEAGKVEVAQIRLELALSLADAS